MIAAGLTPASYATHLVEVVASARREREPSFAALAMARHSELEGRVRAVLDSGRSHARLSARRLAAMLLAGVMFLVPVGLIRVEARAHDAPRLERLPEGVKIEVIGVSSHPSGAATWWKPHGKPLETAPCDPPAETVKVAGKDVREIVVRITGLPKDAGLEWSTSQSRSRRMAIPRRAGQPVTELQAVIAEFPPGQSTCDVHFDLALGEWSTAQVFDGHGTIAIQKDDQEVFFGRAREFNEGTAIAVAHNIAERAVRVIAIDEDGKEHQPRNRSSGGSGHLYGLDVEFNLPPSKIREYRLQSRPVGRYEIKNVALQRTKSGA